ncbi:MAG: HAD-IIB family hydrolase [Pseudomonadota bacterium]
MVFTDLDGTLLDHDTYSWAPARPALDELRKLKIPLVLVSSKTLAELETYRRELDLEAPVVAENGASIWTPDGFFRNPLSQQTNTPSRDELQAIYRELKDTNGYDCQAFFELGVAGIMQETGLSESRAQQANTRTASEPIRWLDSDRRALEFEQAAITRGLRCVRGGRFLHLMADTGKAEAVGQLIEAFIQEWPGVRVMSVSLGDGPNDLGMLATTDIAVLIPGKHAYTMNLDSTNLVLRPSKAGPAGWNDAVRAILAEHVADGAATHIDGD